MVKMYQNKNWMKGNCFPVRIITILCFIHATWWGKKGGGGVISIFFKAKFCHSMMTSSNGNIFRVTGHLCGEFTGPVNSPHKGQWRGAVMFSLICVWINGWVNNHEAGDLRRYRAHYDVRVMVRRTASLTVGYRRRVTAITRLWWPTVCVPL